MLVLFWKFAKFTNFKFGPKNLRKFLCLRKFEVLVNLLIKQTQGICCEGSLTDLSLQLA